MVSQLVNCIIPGNVILKAYTDGGGFHSIYHMWNCQAKCYRNSSVSYVDSHIYHITVVSVSLAAGILTGIVLESVRLTGANRAHSLLISCPDPIFSGWDLGMRLIRVISYNQYTIRWLAC